MNMSMWDSIIRFMDVFMARPLNKAFLNPVDPEKDQLVDYNQIVFNPMDLSTVKSKIQSHEYKTFDQWFNDVCLIYQNALLYHTEKNNKHWCDIATFLMDDFKSLASKYNFSSVAEWNKIYTDELNKFGEILERSAVSQGMDDFVAGCAKRAEKMSPIPPQEVPTMVKCLEKCLEDTEKKRCIIAILKKTQKNLTPEKETDTLTIKIDELNNNSLNALNLFVRAFPMN